MFGSASEKRACIAEINRSIISDSNLRVVVLCGLQAQADIMSAFDGSGNLFGPYQLHLREDSSAVFFLAKPDKTILKVFIAGHEPHVASFLRYARQRRQITDVFGTVQALSGEGLTYRAWEKACFFAALFEQIRREKEGAEPMPVVTAPLDPVFGDWLCHGGFYTKEVPELEQTAGSLTLGILWITKFLANRSENLRGYRGKHDAEAYEKTRQLFELVYGRRLELVGLVYGKRPNVVESAELNEVGQEIAEGDKVLTEEDEDDDECEEVGPTHPMVTLVTELASDLSSDEHSDEQDDEQDDDGSFASGSGHLDTRDESSSSGQLPKATKMRKTLDAMMTDSGAKIKAAKMTRHVSWRLSAPYSLISFVVQCNKGEIYPTRPLFAIRAELTPEGTANQDCALPHYDGCIPSDPCVRLGLQYRLLDGHNGKGPWEVWRSAQVTRQTPDELERVFKLNALVEILEGASTADLAGVPRRSVRRWTYNMSKGRSGNKGSTTRRKQPGRQGKTSALPSIE